jgi:polyphosphate kinase
VSLHDDILLATLRREFPASKRFNNRELSWLQFNDRVLEEALDPSVPALERLKFLAIFASNLDEFFMVRVANVRREMEAGITRRGADGLRPAEVMERITERVRRAHERIGSCYREAVLPALNTAGIHIVSDASATSDQRQFAGRYFASTLRPLLRPIVLDAAYPFPELENRALYFAIELEGGKKERLVLLRVPTDAVNRFLALPVSPGVTAVMMIDDIIRMSLDKVFEEGKVTGCYEVKVVRDSELELDDVGSKDVMKGILHGLERRRRQPATRFLYDPAMPGHLLERFARQLKLRKKNMFEGARYHSFSDLLQIPSVVHRPDQMYPPAPPLHIEELERSRSIIDIVRRRDMLLHHPYQSFTYVARFFEEAASDEATVELKATLYRVSSDSRVATALANAARNGKKVTVVVELKARFDEERNIGWAQALGEAGATVVYGVKGLKTHCKLAMVVRKEEGVLRRYCHLATGNYNDRTAGMYSDLGLFTGEPGLTSDVERVFGRLTGGTPVDGLQHLLVAPETMRAGFVHRIRREARHAQEGRPSGIVAKMNSLVDEAMVDELYLASRAGVQVRLIVRGICCLRPGVTGLSENIEVTSIIDRYLEHARVYRFENSGSPEIFLASADWMPRNLNTRVEVAFPLLDASVRAEVDSLLQTQLTDTTKARILHADGTNHRRRGEVPVRSQSVMYERARRFST